MSACARIMWHRGGVRCNRRGKVERDGKPYCGQHDPVAREARLQKTLDRYRAEELAKAKERALAEAAPRLYSALEAIADGKVDPRNVSRYAHDVLAELQGTKP